MTFLLCNVLLFKYRFCIFIVVIFFLNCKIAKRNVQRWGNKSNTNINAFQTILTKQVKRPLEYDYILLYVFLHFLCTLFKIFCMNFRIWLVRWQNWILIHFNTVIEIYWNYKHVIIFCNEYFRCIWTTVIIWIEFRFLLLTEYHDSTKLYHEKHSY